MLKQGTARGGHLKDFKFTEQQHAVGISHGHRVLHQLVHVRVLASPVIVLAALIVVGTLSTA